MSKDFNCVMLMFCFSGQYINKLKIANDVRSRTKHTASRSELRLEISTTATKKGIDQSGGKRVIDNNSNNNNNEVTNNNNSRLLLLLPHTATQSCNSLCPTK